MRHRSILVFALSALMSLSAYAESGAATPRKGRAVKRSAVEKQQLGGEKRAAKGAQREARQAAKARKVEVRALRAGDKAQEPLRPKDYSRDHQVPASPAVPFGTTLLAESFDTGIPVGWAVVDNAGSGVQWTNLVGCGETANWSGGAGDVACVSSDVAGTLEYDTELRTPVINLSGFAAPASLTFNANYANLLNIDFLDVDVSTNGAAGPWTNLLSWNESHGGFRALPGEAVNLDIASVVGQANVMFRFHYYDPLTGDFDWYAQVDDVVVTATPGGGCTLTCPADQNVANTVGLCSGTANFPAPTTSGQCGAVTCSPVSGGSFPVGTTLVTCTEIIPNLGQGASCSFNVNVDDLEPPVLTCPADQGATIPGGQTTVVVNYPVLTQTDNCPGAPDPTCVPPSGSAFPGGTTPVACTGADAAGNTSGCGFDVNVDGGASIVEIPTASTMGLAGLALLLVSAAFVVLRRQH